MKKILLLALAFSSFSTYASYDESENVISKSTNEIQYTSKIELSTINGIVKRISYPSFLELGTTILELKNGNCMKKTVKLIQMKKEYLDSRTYIELPDTSSSTEMIDCPKA